MLLAEMLLKWWTMESKWNRKRNEESRGLIVWEKVEGSVDWRSQIKLNKGHKVIEQAS